MNLGIAALASRATGFSLPLGKAAGHVLFAGPILFDPKFILFPYQFS